MDDFPLDRSCYIQILKSARLIKLELAGISRRISQLSFSISKPKPPPRVKSFDISQFLSTRRRSPWDTTVFRDKVDKESNNARRARIRSLLVDAEDELDIHEEYDQGNCNCINWKIPQCSMRTFDSIMEHKGLNLIMISPRSQWEEYICPCCDDLMDDPILTSCGHRMCYKCFDEKRSGWGWIWSEQWCPVRDDYGQKHMMSQDDWSKDRTAESKINKLLVKCGKCEVECTVKNLRKFDCSIGHQRIKSTWIKSEVDYDFSCNDDYRLLSSYYHQMHCKHSERKRGRTCSTATADYLKFFDEFKKLLPNQQQKLITKALKQALPAAKGDLSIDKICTQLYQSGVITNKEATKLLGIFNEEEKITRFYTEMLPRKGLKELKKYMEILYDTGWNTPSHMRHHGVLLIKLSEKLSQIKSQESVLRSENAAVKAIIPMVYSESLPDAVINISTSINKLLLPMLKKHILSATDYYWLRGASYHGMRSELLYKEILPQKGVKGLKAFMEVLYDVGKKTPKHQKHLDVLKANLQAHLSKF